MTDIPISAPTFSPTLEHGPAWSLRRRMRIYRLEAGYEFLKMLRLPMFSVPALTFPLLFYVLFGLTFGNRPEMAAHLLAGYGAFGVIGAALFSFGVGVAVERGQGWTEIKRASPMPPAAYFTAKIAMSLLFAAIIIAGMIALSSTLGGVRMPIGNWIALSASLLLGALPFCAMGLALGYLCGPNSAPAVVNLIYLPMAFASGLWIPIQVLPSWVQTLAPALPAYHLAQLALGSIGLPVFESPLTAILALLGFAVAGLLVAGFAFRRTEGKTWG